MIHVIPTDVQLAKSFAIAELARIMQEHLAEFNSKIYFSIDTNFLINGADPWQWLKPPFCYLINAADEVIKATRPHRIHRYFLIRSPFLIKNRAQRKLYRYTIKLVIHYHLWHGVVCYIHFVHPNEILISDGMDMAAISHDIAFDTSQAYCELEFNGFNRYDGSTANDYIKNLLRQIKNRTPIMLAYNQDIFSNKRLRADSSYWKNVDRFFREQHLGEPCCDCCTETLTDSNFSIDHITSLVGGGTSQLINLQPLSKKCNFQKGTSSELSRAYIITNLIPDDVLTNALKENFMCEPFWLSASTKKIDSALKILTRS